MMKALVSAALFLLCMVGYSESARAQEEVRVKPADVYLSVFGGYSFPFKTDVSQGGFTLSDVDLDNSPSIGGKFGMWMTLTRKIWGIDVGAEIDVTNFNPDTPGTVELDATYFGVNLMARLPIGVEPDLPNGRWFPYIGVGGGGERLTMKVPGTNEGRGTAPAFQGIGGVKVFFTKHFAAFAEGKFIHASHSQEVQGGAEIDLTLSSVHGVGGLSVHFQGFYKMRAWEFIPHALIRFSILHTSPLASSPD
jgi:opacity protein-like surface antigen